jgi:pilus assembly protein CpaD
MNAMVPLRQIAAASAALALLLSTGAVDAKKKEVNRSVESVHQPVVERTDYVLDLATGPRGLRLGEAERLTGWFEGLNLGYADTIMLDDPAAWHGGTAEQSVAAIVSRYGMLIAHDAPPLTVGQPAPGTLRVVVSRATAHVDGCPDWKHDNSEYAGSSGSNFGCSAAVNLAAMIANPEDLVVGQQGSRSGDAMVSVKAIKTFRDAVTTGAGGLKSESTGGK